MSPNETRRVADPMAGLSRDMQIALALETMQVGHLLDRALMPHVAIATKSTDAVEELAIAEWMGASPVYTGRMRRLMGIGGDGVGAIMKALQLDVGFPHQYMDVGWELRDESYGEFWLRHCGALLDVEPHGERRVLGMCHHIEDPTFDATAYATNGRARIRPIHRPPRIPKDRSPHCHWTIEIDPANEPVKPAPHTHTVASLPLASIAIPETGEGGGDGRNDYRCDFDPAFRLGHLSSQTLAAVTREFRTQCHLLSSSAEIVLTARLGVAETRRLLAAQWTAASWVAGQRLARALGLEGGSTEALAQGLLLLATLPPGFDRSAEIDAASVRLSFTPERPELLDPEQPGWIGLFVRGEAGGLAAAARALHPAASVRETTTGNGRVEIEIGIDPSAASAEPPPEAAFMGMSTATGWRFDLSKAR